MSSNFPVYATSLKGTKVKFSLDKDRLVYARGTSTGYIRGQVGYIDSLLSLNGVTLVHGRKRSVSPWNGYASASAGFIFLAEAQIEYEIGVSAPTDNADNYGTELTGNYLEDSYPIDSHGSPHAALVCNFPTTTQVELAVHYHSYLTGSSTHGFYLYVDGDKKAGPNTTNADEADFRTVLALGAGPHEIRAEQWTSAGAVARTVSLVADFGRGVFSQAAGS
jgi:hypothetical protein